MNAHWSVYIGNTLRAMNISCLEFKTLYSGEDVRLLFTFLILSNSTAFLVHWACLLILILHVSTNMLSQIVFGRWFPYQNSVDGYSFFFHVQHDPERLENLNGMFYSLHSENRFLYSSKAANVYPRCIFLDSNRCIYIPPGIYIVKTSIYTIHHGFGDFVFTNNIMIMYAQNWMFSTLSLLYQVCSPPSWSAAWCVRAGISARIGKSLREFGQIASGISMIWNRTIMVKQSILYYWFTHLSQEYKPHLVHIVIFA